jgi:hypothetical protein
MGTMTFHLPSEPPQDLRDLERACIAGGPDNMPWPTERRLVNGDLNLQRVVEDSGYLAVPWAVEGHGQLMGASATLMERAAPYDLVVELARGKVNQVRGQASDWAATGVQISAALQAQVQLASQAFGRTVTAATPAELHRQAQQTLALAYTAADALVATYCQQWFAFRRQRQGRLNTALNCRLGLAPPPQPLAEALAIACSGVAVPLSWHVVEAEETSYRWEACDALIAWAQEQHLTVTAGPLIDFSSSQLPAWLWLWERDLPSLATFMCRYVENAVRRYRGRIRRWHLTAASNYATVLHLNEDQLLGLTYRLSEAARQVDPGLEIVIGVSQPWGEYMAQADRTHSPFIFADTLIRSGVNLAALDLEVVMGPGPRGSYCRDRLELSRLLDLYALLGVPLSLTLGYPSAAAADLEADPEQTLNGGHWRDGFTPAVQADWATAYAEVAACKPFVQGLTWTHLSDAEPHLFPHCGLADAQGTAKPALQRLRQLREAHLR